MKNKKNSGIALGFIILFIALFLIIGSHMLMVSNNSIRNTNVSNQVTRQFYSSESALQLAAQSLHTSGIEAEFRNIFNTRTNAWLANLSGTELNAFNNPNSSGFRTLIVAQVENIMRSSLEQAFLNLFNSIDISAISNMEEANILRGTQVSLTEPITWSGSNGSITFSTRPYFVLTSVSGGVRSSVNFNIDMDFNIDISDGVVFGGAFFHNLSTPRAFTGDQAMYDRLTTILNEVFSTRANQHGQFGVTVPPNGPANNTIHINVNNIPESNGNDLPDLIIREMQRNQTWANYDPSNLRVVRFWGPITNINWDFANSPFTNLELVVITTNTAATPNGAGVHITGNNTFRIIGRNPSSNRNSNLLIRFANGLRVEPNTGNNFANVQNENILHVRNVEINVRGGFWQNTPHGISTTTNFIRLPRGSNANFGNGVFLIQGFFEILGPTGNAANTVAGNPFPLGSPNMAPQFLQLDTVGGQAGRLMIIPFGPYYGVYAHRNRDRGTNPLIMSDIFEDIVRQNILNTSTNNWMRHAYGRPANNPEHLHFEIFGMLVGDNGLGGTRVHPSADQRRYDIVSQVDPNGNVMRTNALMENIFRDRLEETSRAVDLSILSTTPHLSNLRETTDIRG
ncbi:MAG: hypothetical protein FWF57_01865 [Defluviitaleaceae bacterium]|nr:hypothetical protein [Defluviitaleaceae bacterium]